MFLASFDRPNIRYEVSTETNPRQQLLRMVQSRHPGEAGIVYCRSRKRVDTTAEWLRSRGLDALPYHAGMEDAARRSSHHLSLEIAYRRCDCRRR